jgi:hypothetical protein
MDTLLVSYDLRTPGKDYQKLWDHLKSYNSYCKPLESFWFIKTTLSAEEGRDKIRQFMDSNDRLVVVNVTGREAAWNNLGTAISQWIMDNL